MFGMGKHGTKQVRTIIATRTKKRACEILKISRYEMDTYWSETGNTHEREVALKSPNTIFVERDKTIMGLDERIRSFQKYEKSTHEKEGEDGLK